MRVLALSDYSNQVASARARLYAYVPWLRRDGHDVVVIPVHRRLEASALVDRLAKRLLPFAMAPILPLFDVVIVHRFFPARPEAARLLHRCARRLVFDVDESYHVDELGRPAPEKMRARFNAMLAAADAVVVSNEHLQSYAAQHARAVSVIPTAVDVDRYPSKAHAPRRPTVIGWIGSGGAQPYLEMLSPVFTQLHARYGSDLELRVITSPAYRVRLNTPLAVTHVDWELAREFAFFDEFDIGIMPLPDNERSRGKASYKALQYMAAGIPVVASPVGMNRDVIAPGATGYLPADETEWVRALSTLIDDADLRRAMGARGRCVVVDRFAVEAWYPRFKAALFGAPAA